MKAQKDICLDFFLHIGTFIYRNNPDMSGTQTQQESAGEDTGR